MTAAKPCVVAALGARGTGKSAWVKQHLARTAPKRVAVWDFMREYPGPTDLASAIRAMRAPAFTSVFQPSHDAKLCERQFELWCTAVYMAGNITAIVEELGYVTKPTSAPPGWRKLTLLGRHQRVSIIGTSQRPASIDKDFLANCDLVHCGRLAYKPDADKAAMVLGVDADELLRLPDLAWVERKAGACDASRGTLTFNRNKVSKRAAPLGRVPKARNSTPA